MDITVSFTPTGEVCSVEVPYDGTVACLIEQLAERLGTCSPLRVYCPGTGVGLVEDETLAEVGVELGVRLACEPCYPDLPEQAVFFARYTFCMSLSPCGRYLAVGLGDKNLSVVDLVTGGRHFAVSNGSEGGCYQRSLAFSATHLIANARSSLDVFATPFDTPHSISCGSQVDACVFHPHDPFCYICTDTHLRRLNTTSWSVTAETTVPDHEAGSVIYCLGLRVSLCGKYVAKLDAGELEVRDATTLEQIWAVEMEAVRLEVTSGAVVVLVGSVCHVHSVLDGVVLHEIEVTSPYRVFTMSRCASWLFAVDAFWITQIEVVSGKVLRKLHGGGVITDICTSRCGTKVICLRARCVAIFDITGPEMIQDSAIEG